MPKIGRNDPCPCGSGKKYKNCCLGKEKIVPFPGTDAGERSDLFEEYRRFAENYDGPGAPPSFRQWRGEPNPAFEFLEGMRREMGDRVFGSEEQLQEFVDAYHARENAAPIEEFLGLSPETMFKIIHGTAVGNTGLLEVSGAIPEKELLPVPVMEEVLCALEKLREAGPIKATAKGNFPPAVVHELYEAAYRKHQDIDFKPRNEDELPRLTVQKKLLKDCGLIKKHKNSFSLTKEAVDLLEKREFDKLYKTLFYAWLDGFNWGYLGVSEELPLIQQAALFSLYILKKKAADLVSFEELGEVFLRAFPALENTITVNYETPAERISWCFRHRFLTHFCASFGLVELKTAGQNVFDRKYFYKTTDFFNKYITFHM